MGSYTTGTKGAAWEEETEIIGHRINTWNGEEMTGNKEAELVLLEKLLTIFIFISSEYNDSRTRERVCYTCQFGNGARVPSVSTQVRRMTDRWQADRHHRFSARADARGDGRQTDNNR